MTTPDLLVFGGTFDPPHQAHVGAACAALARFPAARLLVVPAASPAGAGGVHKGPTAAFADRFAMTKLAFAPLGPRVETSPLESELPTPNYTLTLLSALARSRPLSHLGFLLGQDQLASFAAWHEPKALLALASLVVVPRTSAAEPPADPAAVAKALARRLDLAGEWTERDQCLWLPSLGRSVYLLPAPVGDAASRTTRQALAQGTAVPSDWLAPDILQYIRDHHLYTSTQGLDP